MVPTPFGGDQHQWVDLLQEDKDAFNAAFPPGQPFTDDQRDWFKMWWLKCTQADVDAINAKMQGTYSQVGATVTVEGDLYLNIDLLTDSESPGQTFNKARSNLETLVITHHPTGLNLPPPPEV